MGWEAPNLLDKIFAKPDVADSNVFGNFLGGYLAGKDNAAKSQGDGDPAGASGDASGPSVIDPPPPHSWMGDWAKSTLEGQQMAKNIVNYQHAKTLDTQNQAETAGIVIQNQAKRWAMDAAVTDQAKVSEWMQTNGNSLKAILDAPVPDLKTPQAQAMILNAKKAAIATTQSHTNVTDDAAFQKRIATIAPESRAAIQGMDKNPDGSISAAQWQALAQAEDIAQSTLEQQKQDAADEAEGRGDLPTTTINDKGVSTTYKPPTARQLPQANVEPLTKTLADGTTLAWMPNGKTIHVVRPSGEKKELTPSQLLSLGKSLDDSDKDKSAIINAAKQGAMKQVGKSAASPLPKQESDLVKGRKYQTQRGEATWDGTQFVQ